ncbi:MAG: ribonuclease Y [Planctomycetes bacterium]|nr:ribonuclease Y [Planctomycetota bacterium]
MERWSVVPLAIALLIAVACLGFGYGASQLLGYIQRRSARREADKLLSAARQDGEEIRQKAEVAAKQELLRLREEFERETREARTQLKLLEKRLVKREDGLERKAEMTAKREKYIENLERELSGRQENVTARERQLTEALDKQREALYRISGLSPQDARAQLFERLERDFDREAAALLERKLEQAKETADQRAREVLATAIQRCAVEHTNESVVSTIDLPSDDMKGRIIGREGRNIRAFEKATGVDVIVDDTPGVVVLSAFDSVRREMARRAMEELVSDGRIHPARIEEVIERAKRKTEETIQQTGKQVLFDMGVHTNNQKLAYLLGRLRYRTSYGQNVLQHSVEVAHLMSIMAGELRLDPPLAKRIGLLHDIGKAVDHELEGGHPEIGALIGKRIDEDGIVINAIAAHHEGAPPESVYAVLVQAADAISASRPGARRETLEKYIKRLERLEGVASSFEGVETAYAIQAGREVRVIVKSEKVDDKAATKLARDIAKEIEQELDYPGEIRVTVIRETRAVEYAR